VTEFWSFPDSVLGGFCSGGEEKIEEVSGQNDIGCLYKLANNFVHPEREVKRSY